MCDSAVGDLVKIGWRCGLALVKCVAAFKRPLSRIPFIEQLLILHCQQPFQQITGCAGHNTVEEAPHFFVSLPIALRLTRTTSSIVGSASASKLAA